MIHKCYTVFDSSCEMNEAHKSKICKKTMFTNDKVSYYKFGSIEEINACKLMYKEDSLY